MRYTETGGKKSYSTRIYVRGDVVNTHIMNIKTKSDQIAWAGCIPTLSGRTQGKYSKTHSSHM